MFLEIETKYPGEWFFSWALFGLVVVSLLMFLYGLISYIVLAKEHPKREVYNAKYEGLPPLEFHRPSCVEEDLQHFFNISGCGLLLFLCFGICLGITIPCYIHADKTYEEWYQTEYEEVVYDHIYSMDFQNETYGKFRLGYGEIETKHYYYFYIKVEQDTYSFAKLENKNGNTFIKETDDYGSIIQRKDKNSDFVYYLIKVPHGTVIESYSVI